MSSPGHRPRQSRATLALTFALTTAVCAAQGGAEPESRPAPEWPELSRDQARSLDKACKALRRAKKADRIAELEADLTALGAGATPGLLDRFSDHRTNINASLVRVLDAVTADEHAPLLAEHARDRKTAVRRFVLRRLTEFRRPDMAGVFREARSDDDPEIAFQAALGLASSGDPGSMEEIFAHCIDHWVVDAGRVSHALESLRKPDTAQWVLDRMQTGVERDLVTGLRILRSVGTEDKAALIARHLDAESNPVKKEAINTLRVVVDGAEPLDNLPVFKTIELSKEWRERLR